MSTAGRQESSSVCEGVHALSTFILLSSSHTNPLFPIVFLASIKLQYYAWIGFGMLWL